MKNCCPKNEKKSGFTLVELLIVIVILGILSSFVFASSTGSIKKARNSQRSSDLNQYRIALENYASKHNGLYLVYTSTINAASTLGPALGTTYMASYPADPTSDSSYYYRYQSDAAGSQYILWARLETSPGTSYWYVCANGNVSSITTQPDSSTCGF